MGIRHLYYFPAHVPNLTSLFWTPIYFLNISAWPYNQRLFYFPKDNLFWDSLIKNYKKWGRSIALLTIVLLTAYLHSNSLFIYLALIFGKVFGSDIIKPGNKELLFGLRLYQVLFIVLQWVVTSYGCLLNINK